jgi:transmembrane sensor
MTKERFQFLLEQYLLQQLSEEELQEFFDAAALPEFEPVIKAALDRDLQLQSAGNETVSAQALQSYENFKRILASQQEEEKQRRAVFQLHWFRYAAAVLLLATVAVWMWRSETKERDITVSIAENQPIDVEPGGNRAILTLADGSTIVLDSSNVGMLATQGNVRIEKTASGEIVYTVGGKEKGVMMMNTMSTPRGGQYKLTLPDGSKVWLNAASSITYPAAFTGNDRTVQVDGELYFEVAKDANHPFIVKKGATSVTVLGTHFNVNAYNDEEQLKVTLLEGSVKVSSSESGASALLKPGQQVSVYETAMISQPAYVNTDQVMAWKNGIFNFHKASLQEVMRQLSRWYDVEVVYEKGIPAMQFGGEMGRDLTLSQVLKGFEDMEVHFEITAGKKLIVKP